MGVYGFLGVKDVEGTRLSTRAITVGTLPWLQVACRCVQYEASETVRARDLERSRRPGFALPQAAHSAFDDPAAERAAVRGHRDPDFRVLRLKPAYQSKG